MNAPVRAHLQAQEKVTFPIDGMTCASCVGRVEAALKSVPGVANASVNLATEKAQVTLSAPVARDLLANAVRDVGYNVPSTSIDLTINGMTCASCVGRVEKALKAVPGVATATINLATERAHVTGSAELASLIDAVAQTGYEAKLLDRS
ncbi:MAG: copper ion binding protein, partial [Burkholderiaceae bacterium]